MGVACTVYPDKQIGNWLYVEYNGIKGYALGNYLSKTAPAPSPTPSDIEVSSVSIDISNVCIEVGDTIKLNATVSPSNATYTRVVWNTNSANVSVDNNGVVTGISPGKAVIYAGTGDKMATCNIEVTASSPLPGAFSTNVNFNYQSIENVTISWSKSTNATKYGLTVQNTDTLENVHYSTTSSTSKNIGKLPTGNYAVYVNAVNNEGETSANINYFNVISSTPLPGAFSTNVNFNYQSTENVSISWGKSANATKYGLTVQNTATLETVHYSTTSSTSKNIGKLPAGNYAVYVNAVNNEGETSANINYFNVISSTPLPGAFSTNVSFNYQSTENVSISWGKSTNATEYGLTVQNTATLETVHHSIATSTSRNIGRLPVGNYVVYVTAVNSEGGTNAPINYFNVIK